MTQHATKALLPEEAGAIPGDIWAQVDAIAEPFGNSTWEYARCVDRLRGALAKQLWHTRQSHSLPGEALAVKMVSHDEMAEHPASILALAALTPSALSGDAGEVERLRDQLADNARTFVNIARALAEDDAELHAQTIAVCTLSAEECAAALPSHQGTMSDHRYLLVKRGLYYRPNNSGYTGFKERAGRYPASDADEMSGITAVHEDEADEIAPKCFDDLARDWLNNKLSKMRGALRDIAEAEAIPNDAEAFLWCRDVARAALEPDPTP